MLRAIFVIPSWTGLTAVPMKTPSSFDGDESRQKPLRWLFGQLWNCSDIVASHNRDALEQIGVPEESTWTYARAVRWLSTR